MRVTCHIYKLQRTLLLCLFLSLTFSPAQAQEILSVIPYPKHLHFTGGHFMMNGDTRIFVNTPELDPLMEYTLKILQEDAGISLGDSTKRTASSYLKLQLNIHQDGKGELPDREAYQLEISQQGITVSASDRAGIFYGIQTLRQIALAGITATNESILPCVYIKDRPRFAWRAFMLDEARYFKGSTQVKKLLDEMALLKMNVFHWHLTDDDGWRIEIKNYPLLTEVGSKRKSSQIGPLKWDSPIQSGVPHEGFYTQDEIREIVRYADERHITIVPEIEMPGHSAAAIAAYPWLGTKGDTIEVPVEFDAALAYNVADPRVYTFMTDVLDELMSLFPSEVIHIGGDEVRYEQWKNSEMVRAYMLKQGLMTPADLQIHFTNSISHYLLSKGRRMMGWNEILGHNVHQFQTEEDTETSEELAGETIIHFWKGEISMAENAAERGYQMVNSLHTATYLDYDYQTISLKDAYMFDPVPAELDKKYHAQIIGTGCQMWGEWIPSIGEMEYLVFPRIAAYAEVGWANYDNKDYERFRSVLPTLIEVWEKHNIYYAPLEYCDPENKSNKH